MGALHIVRVTQLALLRGQQQQADHTKGGMRPAELPCPLPCRPLSTLAPALAWLAPAGAEPDPAANPMLMLPLPHPNLLSSRGRKRKKCVMGSLLVPHPLWKALRPSAAAAVADIQPLLEPMLVPRVSGARSLQVWFGGGTMPQ